MRPASGMMSRSLKDRNLTNCSFQSFIVIIQAILYIAEADVGDVGEGKRMGLQKVFHAFLGSSKINMYLCSKNEQQ